MTSSIILNDIIKSDDNQLLETKNEEDDENPSELWLFNSLAERKIQKLTLEENAALLSEPKEFKQEKIKDPLKLLEKEVNRGFEEGDTFFAGRSKHTMPEEILESESEEETTEYVEEIEEQLEEIGEESEEISKKDIVILEIEDEDGLEKIKPKAIYLRQKNRIGSLPKLFENLIIDSKINIIDKFELSSDLSDDLYDSVIEIQKAIDFSYLRNEEFCFQLFQRLKNDHISLFHHIKYLKSILPVDLTLNHFISQIPEFLFYENKEIFKLGIKFYQALFPHIHDIERGFKLGFYAFDIIKDVFMKGKIFKKMLIILNVENELNEDTILKNITISQKEIPDFINIIENTGIPIICKIIKDPIKTKLRFKTCQTKLYKKMEFNPFYFSNFTINSDDTKFSRFCEMFNILYPIEKRVQLTPKQYEEIYEAYLILEIEGLSWKEFIKGLNLLGKWKFDGIYQEYHLEISLKESIESPSRSILKNAIEDYFRLKCQEGILKMDLVKESETYKIFELEPLVYMHDIM